MENLVSPKTGVSLVRHGDSFFSSDGKERFTVEEGIVCLLDTPLLDESKTHERAVFDSLKIQNVSYVRDSFLKDVLARIKPLLGRKEAALIAEMGGGEGHWARHLKSALASAQVFVCDLSRITLNRAPKILNRVCADVTGRIFAKGSMDLICFWVSLHHLDPVGRVDALRQAAEALVNGGILLVFEPNKAFSLRQVMYNTRLSKDVYPDEREQALDFGQLSATTRQLGLEENGIYFLNPPYNVQFVRKLKKWILYFCAVEFLYQLDQWILNPVWGNLFSLRRASFRRYTSLYGLAIYRKIPLCSTSS